MYSERPSFDFCLRLTAREASARDRSAAIGCIRMKNRARLSQSKRGNALFNENQTPTNGDTLERCPNKLCKSFSFAREMAKLFSH